MAAQHHIAFPAASFNELAAALGLSADATPAGLADAVLTMLRVRHEEQTTMTRLVMANRELRAQLAMLTGERKSA